MLKKITGILGLSFWELLTSLPHGTPGGIYLTGFGILCQDFGVHHMIIISNHREPLPHSLTHSIHRNYHFTDPTVATIDQNIQCFHHLSTSKQMYTNRINNENTDVYEGNCFCVCLTYIITQLCKYLFHMSVCHHNQHNLKNSCLHSGMYIAVTTVYDRASRQS